MPNDSLRLGDYLRTLRRRAGLSQQKLADKSGISRIAISMIETERQRPSKRIANQLAEALGISSQSIYEFSSSRPFADNRVQSSIEEPRLVQYDRIERERQRVTLDIPPDFDLAISDLSKQQSTSKAEIIRAALQSHLENIGYDISRTHEDVSGQRATRRIKVRSAKQVIFHSKLLIEAFEEALNYDVQRHHNQPPPTLRLENKEYLDEIRKLVTELRQMNSFLAALGGTKRGKRAPPGQLSRHLDTFLKKYSATLGYGAGVMTLGLIATLLYQLGAGEAVFDHVLKRLPGG